MQPVWSSMMWFVVVVAAIPFALWLFKRSGLGGGAGAVAARQGMPRTLSVMPLSAQQRVVTVEVGQGDARTWLVLGVSPQGIRTLHTMPAQSDTTVLAPANGATPPAMGFAQMLSRLRKGDDHAPR